MALLIFNGVSLHVIMMGSTFMFINGVISSTALFIARPDHDRRDRGPLQQPVERNLRHGLAGLLRYCVECIDDLVDMLDLDRRRPCSGC